MKKNMKNISLLDQLLKQDQKIKNQYYSISSKNIDYHSGKDSEIIRKNSRKYMIYAKNKSQLKEIISQNMDNFENDENQQNDVSTQKANILKINKSHKKLFVEHSQQSAVRSPKLSLNQNKISPKTTANYQFSDRSSSQVNQKSAPNADLQNITSNYQRFKKQYAFENYFVTLKSNDTNQAVGLQSQEFLKQKNEKLKQNQKNQISNEFQAILTEQSQQNDSKILLSQENEGKQQPKLNIVQQNKSIYQLLNNLKNSQISLDNLIQNSIKRSKSAQNYMVQNKNQFSQNNSNLISPLQNLNKNKIIFSQKNEKKIEKPKSKSLFDQLDKKTEFKIFNMQSKIRNMNVKQAQSKILFKNNKTPPFQDNQSFVDLLTADPFKYSHNMKSQIKKTPIRLTDYLGSEESINISNKQISNSQLVPKQIEKSLDIQDIAHNDYFKQDQLRENRIDNKKQISQQIWEKKIRNKQETLNQLEIDRKLLELNLKQIEIEKEILYLNKLKMNKEMNSQIKIRQDQRVIKEQKQKESKFLERLNIDQKLIPKKLNYFNKQFQSLSIERDIYPIGSDRKQNFDFRQMYFPPSPLTKQSSKNLNHQQYFLQNENQVLLNQILQKAQSQENNSNSFENPHPIQKNNSEYDEIVLSNEDIQKSIQSSVKQKSSILDLQQNISQVKIEDNLNQKRKPFLNNHFEKLCIQESLNRISNIRKNNVDKEWLNEYEKQMDILGQIITEGNDIQYPHSNQKLKLIGKQFLVDQGPKIILNNGEDLKQIQVSDPSFCEMNSVISVQNTASKNRSSIVNKNRKISIVNSDRILVKNLESRNQSKKNKKRNKSLVVDFTNRPTYQYNYKPELLVVNKKEVNKNNKINLVNVNKQRITSAITKSFLKRI